MIGWSFSISDLSPCHSYSALDRGKLEGGGERDKERGMRGAKAHNIALPPILFSPRTSFPPFLLKPFSERQNVPIRKGEGIV